MSQMKKKKQVLLALIKHILVIGVCVCGVCVCGCVYVYVRACMFVCMSVHTCLLYSMHNFKLCGVT